MRLLARFAQQFVGFGPAFDGTRFHSVGAISDQVVGHVLQMHLDHPYQHGMSDTVSVPQEAAIFCMAAVKLNCRGDRPDSEVKAACNRLRRIRL
jgi:hypothetical protein